MIRGGDISPGWKVFASSTLRGGGFSVLEQKATGRGGELRGGEGKTQEPITWSWKQPRLKGLHLSVGICALIGTADLSQDSGSYFPLKIHAAEIDSFSQLS